MNTLGAQLSKLQPKQETATVKETEIPKEDAAATKPKTPTSHAGMVLDYGLFKNAFENSDE